MTLPSVAHYDALVANKAATYASTRFEEVHQDIIEFLPASGASVLDVGAGSGRDAAALATLGYAVTAVEPSRGMRKWALANAPQASVRWLDDALPALGSLTAEGFRFDFILCSAVLMHLTPREVEASFQAMAALLAPGGAIAVSVRGAFPEDPPHLFHTHTTAALRRAASKASLRLRAHGANADQLGRSAISWRWFVFQT